MSDRLRQAVQDASDAYWAKIAEHYPEMEFGDVDPHDASDFYDAGLRAVTRWIEGNAVEPLSDSMHRGVVKLLRAKGWDARFEFPGVIMIGVGAFSLNIGMHAWDYGTPAVVIPSPDRPSRFTYHVEPFETAPSLDAEIDPESNDAEAIADAWDMALTDWLSLQGVKDDLIPSLVARYEAISC